MKTPQSFTEFQKKLEDLESGVKQVAVDLFDLISFIEKHLPERASTTTIVDAIHRVSIQHIYPRAAGSRPDGLPITQRGPATTYAFGTMKALAAQLNAIDKKVTKAKLQWEAMSGPKGKRFTEAEAMAIDHLLEEIHVNQEELWEEVAKMPLGYEIRVSRRTNPGDDSRSPPSFSWDSLKQLVTKGSKDSLKAIISRGSKGPRSLVRRFTHGSLK